MKSSALSTALLAICVAASAPTFAQHATKTPTAEVDELPRPADDLGFGNRLHDRKDSLLTGGASGPLPSDRVPLPSLCDIDPGHPSCDDESGGGGGGDGAIATANCGFAFSEEVGFTQAMTVNRGVGSVSCFQGGMYSHRPGGSTWVSVAAVFSLPLAYQGSTVTWHGACAGQTGTSCTTRAEHIHVTDATPDTSWDAHATLVTRGVSMRINFTASFVACGVFGDLMCH